jgi:hypothetical protein
MNIDIIPDDSGVYTPQTIVTVNFVVDGGFMGKLQQYADTGDEMAQSLMTMFEQENGDEIILPTPGELFKNRVVPVNFVITDELMKELETGKANGDPLKTTLLDEIQIAVLESEIWNKLLAEDPLDDENGVSDIA